MDEGFKETAAAIARLEGVIHEIHGTAGHTDSEPRSLRRRLLTLAFAPRLGG